MVLSLFVFAFIFRLVVMLWPTFPSGADIGLHASVINSITKSGNTDFMYNYYQMGGGISLTFPGYHIFASLVINITGLPNYLAQALVVAFFSALIVLASYLVTRAAWTESAALIVAFLVAVSRFDIEMLNWGGYPNIITLFLIPLTFYLFLQREKFSTVPFIVSTSILAGSIFLTHSLSSVIFVAITVATALVVIVRPSAFSSSRKQVFFWLLPIGFGAVLVSPFLFDAAKAYLHTSSALTAISLIKFKGVMMSEINAAILSTKIIPLEIIVPLFAILALFFLLSKEYKGRYLSISSLLFFLWLFVPLILTQGYIDNWLVLDYNRFLYFLLLPVLVLFGMFLDHGALFFSRFIDTYRTLTNQLQKKAKNKYIESIMRLSKRNLYLIIVTSFLVASLFLIPLYVTPSQGIAIGEFYQVMDKHLYEGIQWAKDNTTTGSILVSNATYGWWLGGFSERPTISAVSPEYLSGVHELNPAKNASLLLDTDYMIDNGLIQVREDGGYISRHNPEILTKLNWTYFPYSFFNLDSSKIEIYYRLNDNPNTTYLSKVPCTGMQLQVNPSNNDTTIILSRGNELFNYTEYTTVYQGLPFVNITTSVNSTVNGFELNYITFNQIEGQGTYLQSPQPTDSSVSWIDQGVKAFGQLIFSEHPYISNDSESKNLRVEYSFGRSPHAQFQILATTYSVTDSPQWYTDQLTIDNYFSNQIAANQLITLQHTGNTPITTFDYQAAIKYYNISYIANCDSAINPKFADDPHFVPVFINEKVAIFKVEDNANQAGR